MRRVPATTCRGRRALTIENGELRVTVLREGGHIAEVLDTRTGINPLWSPPWDPIEPSAFDAAVHSERFGRGSDARLLAGIAGHNLCLDIFGGPSDDEAARGMTAHGEGSVATYEIAESGGSLCARAEFPLARIRFERRLELVGRAVQVEERVESRCDVDRPIGWTQHVTLGPPFLEKGITEFRASATRSRTYEGPFGVADYLEAATTFEWPSAPRIGGGAEDLRRFTDAAASSAYTAHLMAADTGAAFFVAFSPRAALAFGYVWDPADFPWLGIWEENCSRSAPPWNGRTIARGMEFGVSPFPESRRRMVERAKLFDVPTFRWLPARRTLTARYVIVLQTADRVPELTQLVRSVRLQPDHDMFGRRTRHNRDCAASEQDNHEHTTE
jgi:hypothetical protein